MMLFCPLILSGQMLLFIDLMADVEPFYSVLTDVLIGLVADLIAKLLRADVIALCLRWNVQICWPNLGHYYIILAVVITNFDLRLMLLPCIWQMLLPFV